MAIRITELLGDGISGELAQSVRIVADKLPVEVQFDQIDLSLENRERRGLSIYDEAVQSMHQNRFTLKYPTTTRRESPNAILRNRCKFSVIHRPVHSIPGVPTNFRK